MEHLNRDIKTSIAGMGSNVTDNSILRAGKSLKKHVAIQKQFDLVNNVTAQSGKHSRRSSLKDRATIVDQLVSAKVFKSIPGREYNNFKTLNEHMYNSMSMSDFKAWLELHLQKVLMSAK